MKKCLFLSVIIFSVLALPAVAQEAGLPLVEEGRTWHTVSLYPRVPLSQVPLDNVFEFYQKLLSEGTCTASQHEYVLKGDTVIIGKTYKKLLTKDSSEKFLTALRQEGDRVYAIDDEGTSEYTLFDFSLKVGDIVKSHVDELEMMRVEQVDTVLVDGKECRRLYMWAYEKDVDITSGLVDIWIEGVGCMSGPFFTFAWSATSGSSLLLGCYQNDRQLVITDKSTAGIKHMNLSSGQTDCAASYDLQGRAVTNPRRGLYIKDGRKIVLKE